MTQLRILATGSRDHRDYDLIHDTIARLLGAITTIGAPVLIQGGQVSRDRETGERYGADFLAKRAWTRLGEALPIPLEQIEEPADWTGPCDLLSRMCFPNHRKMSRRGSGTYCPTAGFRRNQLMLDKHKPTRAVAFPLGRSNGTRDMIERLEDAGIPVDVIEPGVARPPQLRLVNGDRS